MRGFELDYIKLKSCNCQLVAKCKICIKEYKFDLCKVSKKHNRFITYSKNRKCDTYALQNKCYQYISKKILYKF